MIRRKSIFSEPGFLRCEKDEIPIITKEYSFKLVTPMVGGGANSWELDTAAPVRGQSVKGQLRFWWRTMQDAESAEELLQRENAIWGGVTENEEGAKYHTKSPVSLEVYGFENIAFSKAEMANKYALKDDILPRYASFPIRDRVKDGDTIHIITALNFKIRIGIDQKRLAQNIAECSPDEVANTNNEILNSLKLWSLFGGVGARSRRGLGTIYCEELLSQFTNETDVFLFLDEVSQGDDGQYDYPRLSGAKLYCSSTKSGSPAKAWKDYLESYGRYRQARRVGETKPGRSYWPEPDSIRKLLMEACVLNGKSREIIHKDIVGDGAPWFPRAAFGLPIVTKFSTEEDVVYRNNITLKPCGKGVGDRLPSPIVIKVIVLPNGVVLKVALALNQRFPKELCLSVGDQMTISLKDKMMPFCDDILQKTMHEKDPLAERAIYKHFADNMGLKEVICKHTS